MASNTSEGSKITVPYVSVWDGGITVETTAQVDIRTGEVSDIAIADVDGLEICEREYVLMNDSQVNVYQDEHGYNYLADIRNEFEDSTKAITTNCLNGTLRSGDMVISTPDDDYPCLIGQVLSINPAGTPEHAEETENETDDVHVSFFQFGYSPERTRELEAIFTDLYGEPRRLDECPIDDTIMAPEHLIRITGIDEAYLQNLFDCGFNAACYCYCTLANLNAEKTFENKKTWRVPVAYEMSGIVEVKASTLGEAIEIARDESSDIPLPDNASYVDGSWSLSHDDVEEIRTSHNDNQQDLLEDQ